MLKTRGRYSSGRICVRLAWTRSVASQTGRKRGGAGVSGSGSGARGRSSSSLPSSSRKRRSSQPLQRGREVADRQPAQSAISACGPARSRPGSAARGARRPRRGVDLLAADPVLGVAYEVGAPPLPGARGRNADEREPGADSACLRAPAEQLLDLLPAGSGPARGRREPRAASRSSRARARRGASRSHQLALARSSIAERERPVVAARDEVDRGPHQRRLDDRPPLERARECVALEPVQPRPQADVHRGRVLRLDPADPLERPRDRRPRPLQQVLAGEEGPVQVALRERTRLGRDRHGAEATLPSPRGYSSAGRAPGSHPGGRRFESD